MSEEHEPTWGLVMPFVTVRSKGGPHDDDSFVAGYECGQLARLLQYAQSFPGSYPEPIKATIHAESVPQADLIAMRFGFALATKATGVEGWSDVEFTRASDDKAGDSA